MYAAQIAHDFDRSGLALAGLVHDRVCDGMLARDEARRDARAAHVHRTYVTELDAAVARAQAAEARAERAERELARVNGLMERALAALAKFTRH